MRRAAALTVVALLAIAGSVVPVTAGAAVAEPTARCSASKGVLVVVDFRPFGGSITRACDSTPSTGFDALTSNYGTEGTRHDGPTFVCRINDRPTPAADPCVRTPPTSAYWSYWFANPGQSRWTYSGQGSASRQPPAGSIDAWVFGATDTAGTNGGPCFTPADARAGRATGCAPRPAPAPRTTPGPRRTLAPPTRTSSVEHPRTARVPSASAHRTRSAPTSSARTSSSPGSPASPASPGSPASPVASASTAATSDTAPAIVDATPAAADRTRSDGGSALPLILVVVVVALLGAGAGWTVLRRRRSE